MPARFAVVNGMPGTGIQKSLQRYSDWCGRNGQPAPMLISLENDHLIPLARDMVSTLIPRVEPADVTIMEVLRLPKPLLIDYWRQALDSVNGAVQKALEADQPVILTFHAVWFHLSVREYVSGIDFAGLANLRQKPDIVFTLIDDIYDIKARLSQPRGIFSYDVNSLDEYLTANLRLLRILDWRDSENVFSSKVAEISAAPHFVLAVKQHISVFHDLFSGADKKLVYVAHPVTEVRRLQRGTVDQQEFAKEITDRIQNLSNHLREQFVVFEPTAIDELRFDRIFEIDKEFMAIPALGNRWPFPSGERADLLFEDPEFSDDAFGEGWTKFAGSIGSDESESLGQEREAIIRRAWPSLKALQFQILQQITSRDHSLVTQVDGMAVFRPAFGGHASRGVEREILYHQILQKAGLKTASVVILHPESDEHDALVENFKLLTRDWKSQGKLVGTSDDFEALESSLTYDQLKQIQDLESAFAKREAISELLRQHNIVFLTRAPRPMGAETAADARDEEIERGNVFTRLQSYLMGLNDVEVISDDLSVEEFSKRVEDRIR